MSLLFWLIIIFMTLIALAMVIVPLIKKQNPAYCTAIAITLCLPFLSLLLYLHWGASQKLEQYWLLQKQAALVKVEMAKIKSPFQLINQLRAHLQMHPNSPKGWYLLGRIYLKMQQYQHALSAFQQAYQLRPNNVAYTSGYAEAEYLTNKQISPKIIHALTSAIKKDPHNITAINLLAINAYNKKRFLLAISYWERLIPLFESGSADSQALLEMISHAQKKLKNNEIIHK